MKTVLSGAALLSFIAVAPAQSQDFPPFPEPAVGPFPDTERMRLLAQLTPAEIGSVSRIGGVNLNDIWGWTSPRGEEYALIGTADGMSIVRVTDPDEPEFIALMPTSIPGDGGNLWGQPATFNLKARRSRDDDDDDGDDDDDDDGGNGRSFTGYAYYTTEAEGVGIHILELNQLDDLDAADPSFTIQPTAVFADGGYAHAHNIFVNQDSGFAYVMGVELEGPETACDGEPFHPSRFNTLILDLKSDPLNPQIVACRADAGEHDVYVVNYKGPDRDYRGREIAFIFDGRDLDAAGRNGQRTDESPGVPVGGATEIWDVTDKDNIKVISSIKPRGLCFSHQGWTSSKRHEFLLINDELDEPRDEEPNDGTGFFRTNFCQSDGPQVVGQNPSTYVINIRDLDNPVFQERFFVESPGDNDHNFIRRKDKLYWAVYSAGTRVLKMKKRRGNLRLEEVARLDSEPRPAPIFNGQWGIFPFETSNTIIASDINNGLMVMRLGGGRDDDDEDDDGDDLRASSAGSAASSASAAAAAATAAPAVQGARAMTRDEWLAFVKSRLR